MVNELKQSAIDVVLDPKTAVGASATTAAGGFSDLFLHIPWAAVVGSVVSILLLIIQVWRFVLDRRIRLLEEKILEKKIEGGE